MKFLAVTGLLATTVAAFPASLDKLLDKAGAEAFQKYKRDNGILDERAGPPQGFGALPLLPPPFDPALQLVNNKGANAVRTQKVETITP